MDTGQIIWIIVGVVVLLVLLGLAVWIARKKQQTEHRRQAQELRQGAQATAGSGGMQQSELEAREAKLEAERARVEADRAETRAAEVEKGHLQERARQEDQVREADRLDPDVDHRSPDYRPDAPTTGTDTTDTADPAQPTTETTRQRATEDPVHEPPHESTGGTHRA